MISMTLFGTVFAEQTLNAAMAALAAADRALCSAALSVSRFLFTATIRQESEESVKPYAQFAEERLVEMVIVYNCAYQAASDAYAAFRIATDAAIAEEPRHASESHTTHCRKVEECLAKGQTNLDSVIAGIKGTMLQQLIEHFSSEPEAEPQPMAAFVMPGNDSVN